MESEGAELRPDEQRCALREVSALDDEELATLAIDGQGEAFGELYIRHEQRVYGFCLRMLGSPHDAADATQETFARLLRRLPGLAGRELNFVAYLLTTARHACYDMIRSGRRVEPVAEALEPNRSAPAALEEDPERAALLAATREQVEVANAALPARHREVLALREVECLSYDEIAEVMDLKANAVAQLISRARIKLRDLIRGSALVSIESAALDCDRALPLIARSQDGEQSAELDWLRSHLVTCAICRARQSAMQDAGVSYRLLIPVVPLIWLRQATIARAAEQAGADWSEVASIPARGRADAEPGPGPGATGDPDAADGGAIERGALTSRLAAGPLRRSKSRRYRHVGVAIAAFLVVLFALTGSVADRLVSSTTQVSSTAPNPSRRIATELRRRHRPPARHAALDAAKGGAARRGGPSLGSGSGANSGGGSAVVHPSTSRRTPAITGGSGPSTGPTSGDMGPGGSGGSSSAMAPGGSGGTSGGGSGNTSSDPVTSTSPGFGGGTSPGSGGSTSPLAGGTTSAGPGAS
jgi:RNA polymerase sigma factor (sigma-70 family)